MKTASIVIIAFVFLTGISTVFAGNTGEKVPKTATLSGKVVDKCSQEALVGVLIKIEGLDLETYTDLDGNFTISGIIPDTYKVKCSMISYIGIEEEVQIDKATEDIEISLQNVTAEQATR